MTDDLVAWLTQIWDEREKAARKAAIDYRGTFRPDWSPVEIPYEGIWFYSDADTGGFENAVTRFIGANDPASVLARIAADRQILALHEPTGGECRTCCGEPYLEEYWDGETETTEWKRAELAWPCDTVRLLAQPYADRERFRDEWRVTA